VGIAVVEFGSAESFPEMLGSALEKNGFVGFALG
jgi:hypothetical protein